MIFFFVFVAQVICSIVRTLSINALVGRRILVAVSITALSDLILLSSWATIMKLVMAGSYLGLVVAVAGSACGNTIAMHLKLRRKTHG
jgi:hypothetical protein